MAVIVKRIAEPHAASAMLHTPLPLLAKLMPMPHAVAECDSSESGGAKTSSTAVLLGPPVIVFSVNNIATCQSSLRHELAGLYGGG